MHLTQTDTISARLECADVMIKAILSDPIAEDSLTVLGMRTTGVSLPVASKIAQTLALICPSNKGRELIAVDDLKNGPDWLLDGLFDDAVCQICGCTKNTPAAITEEPKEKKPLNDCQVWCVGMLEALDAGRYTHKELRDKGIAAGYTNGQMLRGLNGLPSRMPELIQKFGKSENGVVMLIKGGKK